jgi:hypothetical protein
MTGKFNNSTRNIKEKQKDTNISMKQKDTNINMNLVNLKNREILRYKCEGISI